MSEYIQELREKNRRTREDTQRISQADWSEWEEAMRETTPELRAKALTDGEQIRRHAQEGLEITRRLRPEDMAPKERRGNLSREERELYRERRELYINHLEAAIESANARMAFLEPLIKADQERAALEEELAADSRQAEEEEANLQDQEEEEDFQDQEAGANLQAEEERDEWNGFDWTEVENALEAAAKEESENPASTQVYRDRVAASRAAWATREERSQPVTPTSAGVQPAVAEVIAEQPSESLTGAAPQPMEAENTTPQPVAVERSRPLSPTREMPQPATEDSKSRAEYPETRSSVRRERETPQEEAPNMWQRYMPERLGGWSKEKVADWDRRHPKEATDSQTQSAQENREVFKGVTVGELRGAGYTNEQIQRMDEMVSQAQNRSKGLIATLGEASQATLTRDDYQQAGLNNQDMATIYKLSQNDR